MYRRLMRRRCFGVVCAVASGLTMDAGLAQNDECETLLRCVPGVSFDVIYTGEIWHNTKGGIRKGHRYVDELDLQLEVDTEEVFGLLAGGTLFAYGLYNNDKEVGPSLVGSTQPISGIETSHAVRLFELWYNQSFLDDRLEFLFGLWDLNSEFDVNETGAPLINSSHAMGAEFGLTGENGPSVFPVTSLAFRARWDVTENIALKAAVLDAVPGDPDHFSKTAINLSGDEGALAVLEANFVKDATKLTGGYWFYTADFEHLSATDAMGLPMRRDGNDGFYLLAEQRIFSEQANSDQGFSVFARYGRAEDDFNQFESYLGFGGVYTGLIPGRDEDQLGFAFAMGGNGDPFKQAQVLAGSPVDDNEIILELTYRAQITPWLALQPDIQYIFNPGTDPMLRDSLVVGLRFETVLDLI